MPWTLRQRRQRNGKDRRFYILQRASRQKNLRARCFGERSREGNFSAILAARQFLTCLDDLRKIANNPLEALWIFQIPRIGVEICSAMPAVIEHSRSRFDQLREPKHYRVVKRKSSREAVFKFLSVRRIVKSKWFCSRSGAVGILEVVVHPVKGAPGIS